MYVQTYKRWYLSAHAPMNVISHNKLLFYFLIFLNICSNFEFLIPDAPELIANFLEQEQDMSCKRNAFLMLLHAEQERALSYLSARLDQVHGFGDILQLVIVELIYKVSLIIACHTCAFWSMLFYKS